MMGVDRRKENRAAASLVSPRKQPAVMVTPERETPGMMARDWDTPTKRASLIVD